MPFSPNARHVRGVAGERSFAGSVAWYRTTVIVPRAGVYAIRFESVNHQAAVWVDGHFAAGHTGTYLPFEARVRLTGGAHTLVVRADWRDPAAMKADAWHRTWFNFGGINRPVSIRELGASELDSPSIVTHLDGTAAVVDLAVGLSNRAGPRTIAVRGTLAGTAVRFDPVHLGRGQRATVRARVRIARPDLWEPGHPTLEGLRLEVPGEAVFTARVGLREVRWAGGRLELNGEALKLRGASLQEDAPGRGDALTDADADAIVARLKAIGANATRSQHPLSDALLDRLDAAGILVWQGVGPVDAPGAWTSRTPVQQRRALRRVRLNVLQERLHPSVVAWNLANEVAGNGHYGGQPEYVDAAAQLAHRLDPGRPTAVDVWGTHMPDQAGFMYRHVDAVGATNYEGWYDDTLAPPATVQAAIDALARAPARDLPGQGADRQRVRRRGQPTQRARHPGLGELPVEPAHPPHPHLRVDPVARRRARLEPAGLRARAVVRGRLHPPPGAEHRPRARDQPEGPVHLRGAAEAGGRCGAPGVRGLSLPSRSSVVGRRSSVGRVASVLRGAYCCIEGRRVAVGGRSPAPRASPVPGAESLRTSSVSCNTFRAWPKGCARLTEII